MYFLNYFAFQVYPKLFCSERCKFHDTSNSKHIIESSSTYYVSWFLYTHRNLFMADKLINQQLKYIYFLYKTYLKYFCYIPYILVCCVFILLKFFAKTFISSEIFIIFRSSDLLSILSYFLLSVLKYLCYLFLLQYPY